MSTFFLEMSSLFFKVDFIHEIKNGKMKETLHHMLLVVALKDLCF